MTTIDPDAVIDAIARHMPDGVDRCGNWHGCRDILCVALGIKDEDGELYEVIQRLVKEGRLRSKTDHGWTVLSYTEQARRVKALIDIEGTDASVEHIAKVLAGRTGKP